MTTGQRAMSTAMVLIDDGRRKNGRWKRGAFTHTTESGGMAQQDLQRAGFIFDHAPKLVDSVINGKTAI